MNRLKFLQSNLANLKAIKDACTMANKPAPEWVIYEIGKVKSEIELAQTDKIS